MFASKLATGAVSALLLAAALSAPASAGSCVRAGGEGSNVLPDVAKFMANAALANSISALGMKAKGPIATSCKTNLLLTTCVSRQRACK
ncbi:MAG: hypothetical protein JNM89_10655 [Hyphomicrobiaceae bacterium]|nr:hypothetical protein [Hyphomicrobiaceae bacterium]